MNKNQCKSWVGVVGRMLLAYALVFSQSAFAGQNQKTKDKSDSAQKANAQPPQVKQVLAAPAEAQSEQSPSTVAETTVAEEKPFSDGSHQGIKVHGHWTIEVRDPDGTIVTHREFENSLVPAGATLLATLLARGQSVGLWEVDLASGSSGTQGPCIGTTNASTTCVILESGSPFTGGPNILKILSVSMPTAGGTQFRLAGTFTAAASASINLVQTFMYACSATVAPSSPCTNTGSVPFTSAGVNPSVSVATGQAVAFNVVFSFS